MKTVPIPNPGTRHRANLSSFERITRPWAMRVAALALSLLATLAAPAQQGPPGLAEPLNQIDSAVAGSGRTPNSAVGAGPAISEDGRYFAFTTNATNVVAGQNAIGGSPVANLYLRDRVAGTTKLVSRVFGTTASTAGGCSFPSMSRDGRYLSFLSTAGSLVSPSTTGQQVFLYDREADKVTLVSHADGSLTTQADNTSTLPMMSADGSTVVFASLAKNLVPGFTNDGSYTSVFAYRRETGQIRLVTAKAGSTTNAAISTTAAPRALSTTGRWVVFSTQATNVVPGQTTVEGNSTNVYLADTQGEFATVLCNHIPGSPSTPGNGSTSGSVAGVSSDGQYVAFLSAATNLIAGQENLNIQAYLYDRLADKVHLVSHIPGNFKVAGNAKAAFSSSTTNNLIMSDDGRHIVFTSGATDLISEYNGVGAQVYVFDRLSDSNRLVTHLATGSTNGSGGVVVDAVISGNGSRVTFSSNAQDLIEGLTYGSATTNVYAYANGVEPSLMLVSGIEADASKTATTAAVSPIVTANGLLGVFASTSAEYSYLDGNTVADFFGVPLAPVETGEPNEPTPKVPTITSITASGGAYRVGDTIDITVNWSAPVAITGSPSLSMILGSSQVSANYVISASPSSASVFRYTIQAGDLDNDGIALLSPLVLNGATIADTEGREAQLTFSESALNDISVDTTAPSVTSVIAPSSAVYITDQTFEFEVNFSEAVNVQVQNGTPALDLTVGTTARQAAYVSGSGSKTLKFRYTVVAGDQDDDGVALPSAIALQGGTITDATGNAANLALNNVASTAQVQVDAVPPVITGVTLPADGTYGLDRTLDFTVAFSKNVVLFTKGGTPLLPVTIGGTTQYATYVSGSESKNLLFRYTVAAGDNDADGIALGNALSTNGSLMLDAAGNPAGLTIPESPLTNAVFVDTKAPEAPSAPALAAGEDTGFLPDDGKTNKQTLTFVGTAEAGSTVKLYLGSSEVGSVEATNGTWSIPAPNSFPEGSYTLTAVARDGAKNVSPESDPLKLVVDVTAPQTEIGAPSVTTTGPGPVKFVISLSDDYFNASNLKNTHVTLNKTGTANGSVSVSGRGLEWTVEITNIVGNGSLGISLAGDWAKDLAGNLVAPAGPSVTFLVVNNQEPVAVNDGPLTVIEPELATLDVLANDTDAESNALTITSVTQGAHGTVSISSDAKSIQFQPTAGYYGADQFSYTISDGQGGTATGSVTVQISDGGPEEFNQTVLLVGGSGTKGDPVALEAGATYARVNFPTINDAGEIACTAVIRGPGSSYRAVVAGGPPVIVAREGEVAPGTQVKFGQFFAPVLTAEGKVAFEADLAGPAVKAANLSGLWTNIFGSGLELVARLGDSAAELPADARWKQFTAFAAGDEFVAFVASLQRSASVNANNDSGLWIRQGGDTKLLLRKGESLAMPGSPKVASFVALDRTAKSMAQSASLGGAVIDVLVNFTDKTSAWLRLGVGLKPVVLLRSGDKFDEDTVTAFRDHTVGSNGASGAAVLELSSGSGVAVHNSAEVSLVAASGDPLTGLQNGVIASVTAAATDRAASVGFFGTFKAADLGTAARAGVFHSEAGVHQVLAYQGQTVPGGKAKWAKFEMFAMPRSLGPLFQAQTTLAGSTKRSLWATDRQGELHALIEEGQELQVRKTTQKVVAFNALRRVGPTPSESCSFNQRRQMVYLVDLRDGSRAIVRADIP